MNKRHATSFDETSTHIEPWHLLVIALLFVLIAAYGLRSNYSHMVQLRNDVYTADKSGKGVNEALQDLRSYVGQHMNTNMSTGENAVYPPIQLKYTYDRLIQAKSGQTADYNAHIYTAAQKYCEAKIPTGYSGRYRIECIQQYVTSHNAAPDYINPDLYKFDFYTPRWSPDIAGLSIVLAGLSLAAAATLWLYRKMHLL